MSLWPSLWRVANRPPLCCRAQGASHHAKPADLLATTAYEHFCCVTTEALTPWQAHKKYGGRATCETWTGGAKSQVGMGKIRADSFLANAALFHCAVLAYNTLRWMAMAGGDPTPRQWEPETVRAYLVRAAGKLLAGNRQLTVKTPNNHLYTQVWDDWVAVGLGA